MRASRLLSIVILLQVRTRVTAEMLAEEFEVSLRTIYRDIDALSAAGIPVFADRGPGGGFRLLDGYRTNLTGLAADEAEAMLMIGMPQPAAALGLGGAATRARSKLLAALPTAGSGGALRIASRFHLDPVDWYHAAESVAHLPALTRAVLDQRAVKMTYESWTATRDWTVEPLGLVMKAGAWYLVARRNASAAIYKVSNIKTQTVLARQFERPAEFDLVEFWEAQLQRFESGLRRGVAELLATEAGCKRLAQLGAYAANAVAEKASPDARGWSRIQFPIENVEQAAHLLLGLGADVVVLAPVELRKRVRAIAVSIVEALSGKSRLRL